MPKSPTHKERETFVADLIRHAPAADIRAATRLMRLSGGYSRHFGNGKEVRLQEKIKAICEEIRCTPVFSDGVLTIVTPNQYAIGVPGI